MKLTRLAGLDVRIAGGTDSEGGGEGPVVVLLHGFGAPGDDLVSLWRVLAAPPGTRFVFPAAPVALGGGYGEGRAWWWIDIEARMRSQSSGIIRDTSEIPEGLPAARANVEELLGEVDKVLRPPAGKLVLGGFSQGAMLALDVALHSERPLAGLVLLSGTHIAAREWQARYERRRGLSVFMSHGENDPLLPFSIARDLCEVLRAHGLVVDWVPFRGAHAIPPTVVDRAGVFVSRVLGPPDAH
jgi:phospholipase/carboxylesterase